MHVIKKILCIRNPAKWKKNPHCLHKDNRTMTFGSRTFSSLPSEKKILVWNQLLTVNYFKSIKLYMVTERKGQQNILISSFMRKLNSSDTACPFSVQLVTCTPDILSTKGIAQVPFTLVEIRLTQIWSDVKQNKAPSLRLSRKKISTGNSVHLCLLVELHV